jgi:hypothetical protein
VVLEMNQDQNLTENFFKLLIPVTEPNLKTIELCGKPWMLVDFERLSDTPPYTCISYSWGTEKVVNMMNNDQYISVRTIPVIETVINAFQAYECQSSALRSLFHTNTKFSDKLALARSASKAIWIDSLCIPQQQPAADICIQNMGVIYREAAQVFVVLNTACDNTVLKICNKQPLNINDYLAVANDDWIDRVWTYQEFANSMMMFIVAEDKGNAFISEGQFLNALMSDEAAYADIQDIKLSQKLERWQFLVAEQQIEERSAFQVISATHYRKSTECPEDRINAIISVVTDEAVIWNRSLITHMEHFMRVCEDNNDYSFIFSTNPRSDVEGRKWRPFDDQITPVISDVLTFGRGLSGCLKDTHLQMNNMCRMASWKTNGVIKAIEGFVKVDFSKKILKQLQQKGFTGCGDCIKLEHGYFFPQLPHKRSKELFVAISHDVKFQQGAPGLLLRSNDTDINEFCDTGVFIGKAPVESNETINVS